MAMEAENEKEAVLLKKSIAKFYDRTSGMWEDICSDHLHAGFFEAGEETASFPDHRSAQIRTIEEALRFAGLSEVEKQPKRIVDVGCGIGGSSMYLAKKYGAESRGITLSPFQAQRAQTLCAAQGLADQVSFQVADALNQPFPDGQFDLVWAIEIGEHMPNRAKFVSELVRVAAPGATIIIVTWCHRDLAPGEKSLKPDEKAILDKICKAFCFSNWCSAADYVNLLQSHNLQDIKSADWSANAAPFWPSIFRHALTWKGATSLLRMGWKSIKSALALPLIIKGFNKGVVKYAIITCKIPE